MERWWVGLVVVGTLGCGLDEQGLDVEATGKRPGVTDASTRATVRPSDEPRPNGGQNVGLRAPGEACQQATECASGHCTEGVCCHGACEGPCVSCRLPGSEGLCRSLPSKTVCGAPSCQDGIEQKASLCDGEGRCKPGDRKRCREDRCANETTCAEACSGEVHERRSGDDDDGGCD